MIDILKDCEIRRYTAQAVKARSKFDCGDDDIKRFPEGKELPSYPAVLIVQLELKR